MGRWPETIHVRQERARVWLLRGRRISKLGFARDLYQFGWQTNSDVGPQEVAFVLTLRGPGYEPSIYNSTAQMLGTFVESVVINQEIEITNEM
jgi:hypothetical protein